MKIQTSIIGVAGIPFPVNSGPGALVAVEGADLSGKSSICKHLIQHLPGSPEEWRLVPGDLRMPAPLETLLETYLYDLAPPPHIMQVTAHLARLETQVLLEEAKEHRNSVLLDRWIPTALTYGKALGIDEDFTLSLSRHLYIPDVVLVIDRAKPLDRPGYQKSLYDADLQFRERVRGLYRDWLPGFWRAVVPTSPIAVCDVSGLDEKEANQRAMRVLKGLLVKAGLWNERNTTKETP